MRDWVVGALFAVASLAVAALLVWAALRVGS